jgi:hypothetical protein
VKALAAKLPSLEVLYLKQLDGSEANPVCATIPNYRRQLQQWFPQLLVLDGERLQQSTGSVYELADALNKSEAWDAGASELADVDLKVRDWFEGDNTTMATLDEHKLKRQYAPRINAVQSMLQDCKRVLQESDELIKRK